GAVRPRVSAAKRCAPRARVHLQRAVAGPPSLAQQLADPGEPLVQRVDVHVELGRGARVARRPRSRSRPPRAARPWSSTWPTRRPSVACAGRAARWRGPTSWSTRPGCSTSRRWRTSRRSAGCSRSNRPVVQPAATVVSTGSTLSSRTWRKEGAARSRPAVLAPDGHTALGTGGSTGGGLGRADRDVPLRGPAGDAPALVGASLQLLVRADEAAVRAADTTERLRASAGLLPMPRRAHDEL
ncbi:MAG: hypothetical protein JWM62_875, partial [Frankiales bacterium]|nr:hypothetical protein [Frankiales bacterium]